MRVKKINVQRFKQDPAHCAVAASASYANYFNNDIDYEFTKSVAYNINKEIAEVGMEDPEIGILLNMLGFRKVDIVCTDLNYLDYSWASLSKANLIEIFEKESRRKIWKDSGFNIRFKKFAKFLSSDKYSNNLIIDNNFKERIKKAIDKGFPPIITFNWTLFFKFPKYNPWGEPDATEGEHEEHAVLANGYTHKGVYIVDSHHECYKYSLKSYRNGKYFISWEKLMTIMGMAGTIIIGYDYRKNLMQYELVQPS